MKKCPKDETLWGLMLQSLLNASFRLQESPRYRSYYEQWSLYEENFRKISEISYFLQGGALPFLILDNGYLTSSWLEERLKYMPSYRDYLQSRIFREVALKIMARYGTPYGYRIFLRDLIQEGISVDIYKRTLKIALGETKIPQILDLVLGTFPQLENEILEYLVIEKPITMGETPAMRNYLLGTLSSPLLENFKTELGAL